MVAARNTDPPTPSGFALFVVGAALYIAAIFGTWFVNDSDHHLGLGGPDPQGWAPEIATVATVAQIGSFVAIGVAIVTRFLGVLHKAYFAIRGVAGVLGLVALGAAILFVSEMPRDCRLSWAFPVYLQGFALATVGMVWPGRSATIAT